MGANYIKNFMQEHGIKEGQEFKIHHGGKYYDLKIKDNALFDTYGTLAKSFIVCAVLLGEAQIETPKQKTLRDQIEQQSEYWLLDYDGQVSKQQFQDLEKEELTQGNAFLAKSDAEREKFRRNLEFRVKEWLRERECLKEYTGWIIRYYLNIMMSSSGSLNVGNVYDEFGIDFNKYENWGLNNEN